MLRKLFLSAFTLVGLMTVVQAQFDDAYYDPQDNQNSYDRSIKNQYLMTKKILMTSMLISKIRIITTHPESSDFTGLTMDSITMILVL